MTAPKQEVPGKDFDPEPTEEQVEPGTAVAVTPEREGKLAVGDLPPELRASLHAAKVANAMQAEIAKLSWGRSLDARQAGAIAEWGRQYGVDVTTEMDLLGNKPYLNSKFYLRKLALLIEAGRVDYAVADHIEADHRLTLAAKGGNEEAGREEARRLMARIEHGVPDEAVAAVVFRVKLHGMSREVTGCKFVGGREAKDPVGLAFPQETCESRAARRCIRQLASHVPALDEEVERIERATGAVEVLVREAKQVVDGQVAEHRKALGHGVDSERAQEEYGK